MHSLHDHCGPSSEEVDDVGGGGAVRVGRGGGGLGGGSVRPGVVFDVSFGVDCVVVAGSGIGFIVLKIGSNADSRES